MRRLARGNHGNLATCYIVLTVEKLALITISRPQERVDEAKWQKMYSKTLCKGEAQVQATAIMAHVQ